MAVSDTGGQVAPVGRVARCREFPGAALADLLGRFGMVLRWIDTDRPIPGSYWGDCEAGLMANRLYCRADTPIHSFLHEACHFICMDDVRRASLDTDAGGSDAEENGVCYLQILLADFIPDFNRQRMLADMDRWGYSFRLGTAEQWFTADADDARIWLLRFGLIDTLAQPTFRLRRE